MKLFENVFNLHEKALQLREQHLEVISRNIANVDTPNFKARGIDFEQSIETKYLEQLVEKYTEFFHQYDDTPLLIINAESIDLASNDLHFLSL